VIGQVLALVGSVLILLSALGIVRFDDVYAQMHFLTKASTLGVVLVLVGAALVMSHPNDWSSLLLAAFLQLLTSPVAANLISRSTYLTRVDSSSSSSSDPARPEPSAAD
jgi:multicomponent Na+:H+ antiporter subunit G